MQSAAPAASITALHPCAEPICSSIPWPASSASNPNALHNDFLPARSPRNGELSQAAGLRVGAWRHQHHGDPVRHQRRRPSRRPGHRQPLVRRALRHRAAAVHSDAALHPHHDHGGDRGDHPQDPRPADGLRAALRTAAARSDRPRRDRRRDHAGNRRADAGEQHAGVRGAGRAADLLRHDLRRLSVVPRLRAQRHHRRHRREPVPRQDPPAFDRAARSVEMGEQALRPADRPAGRLQGGAAQQRAQRGAFSGHRRGFALGGEHQDPHAERDLQADDPAAELALHAARRRCVRRSLVHHHAWRGRHHQDHHGAGVHRRRLLRPGAVDPDRRARQRGGRQDR